MILGYAFDKSTIFIIGIPIWVILRLIILVIKKIKKKKIIWQKEVMLNLFILYIMILIGYTLLPIEILTKAGRVDMQEFYLNTKSQRSFIEQMGINYIPFYDYYITLYQWMDTREMYIIKHIFITLIGNLFLLTPFIGYICLYNKKIRKVGKCAIVALSISVIIEGIQFIENFLKLSTPPRTININDLILNTLSGVIAYYIFRIVYSTKLKQWLKMK